MYQLFSACAWFDYFFFQAPSVLEHSVKSLNDGLDCVHAQSYS